MKKKAKLMLTVCMALIAVGGLAGQAANEQGLDEVLVEADALWRTPVPMAGGQVNTGYGAGILGVHKMQDTPFTAVSFTEKTIRDYSDPTQPLPSILVNDPSVRTTGSTFYDDFSVRGIKLNGYQLYLNGIPGLFEQGTTPVNYLSRIDVTSGPAMTVNMLTASESAGGLVNMISKKAGDVPNADVTVGFSGRGTYTQQIDVGSRFGKDHEWGIRVNALNMQGETSIPNEKKRQSNIFINMDHRDAKSTTNILLGYVDDSVRDSLRWFTLDPSMTHVPSAPDIHKNYGFKALKWEADKWIATLNHEQKLSENWSAFLNAGYGKYDIYNASNSDWRYTIQEDGSFKDSAVRNPFAYDNRSVQLGLKGKVVSGIITHNLVVAADRYWQKSYNSQGWKFGEMGGNLDDGILFEPDFVPAYPYRTPFLSAKSVYTSWKIVDTMEIGKFNILAGLIKQQVSNTSYIRNEDKSANMGSSTVKSHGLSPLYGIVYKANDQLSLYASHSESFGKGSIISGSQYVNDGQILDPAKTKQNEAGVKYNNGKWMANASVFQITTANAMNVPATEPEKWYKTNNGEVDYKGFDLSIYGQLSEKWNVMGGIMYVDAKTNKSTSGTLDGVRKSGVPQWSGVAGLEYIPSEKWSFLFRGVYSGSYTIVNEKFKIPSYFMVDAGAKYKTQINDMPVTLSAMVYNVFDKACWQPLAGGDNLILSMPRTFMMSASFSL